VTPALLGKTNQVRTEEQSSRLGGQLSGTANHIVVGS